MNITSRWIGSLLILTLLAVFLYGCISSISTSTPEGPFAQTQTAAAQIVIELPNPAYANAQATIDYGKSQLLDLSRKSTEASLNISQAANAAALSTQEYNRRQKSDIDFQATIVSLNIAQAAATQKYMSQQTKMARDATGAAQSSAATATQSAYLMHVTQTAQAQAVLNARDLQTSQAVAALTAYPLTATYSAHSHNLTATVQAQLIVNAQVAQTARANATLTAYPLTATPFAVTQAELLMQQYDREQQSFIKKVVTPLIPILAIIDLLLLSLGIVLAYRRWMPVPWSSRLRIGHVNVNPGPMVMIDGVIVDHDPRLNRTIPAELSPPNLIQLPVENLAHVEIVNSAEPPFAHWIAEVEQQLDAEGGLKL